MKSQKKIRLTIISHTTHFKKKDEFLAYEPYVREIELWAELFQEIEIYTDVKCKGTPKVPVKPLPNNCIIRNINIQAGPGLLNNIKRLIQLPFATIKIFFIVKNSDFLHLRSPGITTVIANFWNIFLNKKTIVKWATIFEEIPQFSKIQKVELKPLKNPPTNTKVLIYGESLHPNHRPSFPALMSKNEIAKLSKNIEPRDWSGKIRLICVGRMSRFKNFDTVIEGLTEFKIKYPKHNWELIFIGDGEERVKIEDLIKSGNLKNEVILKGSLPFAEVLKWYNKSHIAIMPGKYEGWPKVVNEAWSTGCIPFVVNYGNAVYPFKFSTNAGVTYEPENSSFANKLNELFNMTDNDKNELIFNGGKSNYSMTLEKYKLNINNLINQLYDRGKVN